MHPINQNLFLPAQAEGTKTNFSKEFSLDVPNNTNMISEVAEKYLFSSMTSEFSLKGRVETT